MVGIDDDGGPVGLEGDYSTLREQEPRRRPGPWEATVRGDRCEGTRSSELAVVVGTNPDTNLAVFELGVELDASGAVAEVGFNF